MWYKKYQIENLKFFVKNKLKQNNLNLSNNQLLTLIYRNSDEETINNIMTLLSISDKEFIKRTKNITKNPRVIKPSLIISCFLTVFIVFIIDFFVYNDTKNKLKIKKNQNDKIDEYDSFILVKDALTLNSEINSLDNENINISQVDNEISVQNQTIQMKQEEVKKLNQELSNLKKTASNKKSTVSGEYYIKNVPFINQFPTYPTGCELISLQILLKYSGVNVSSENLYKNITRGKTPYSEGGKMYGGNPQIEFIGDPKNRTGYGTFETTIINLANKYKTGIKNITGSSLDEVLKIVKQGHPVQVWATIGNSNAYISNTWIYKKTGEKISWKANEHSLVIIGYNSSEIIVSDPYYGKEKRYNRKIFEARYNYMGKRAIYY